jgi:uncharacterized RDD family membrane protein YckC
MASETRFWVIRDGTRRGPFTEAEVLRDYRAGAIAPADRLWSEGIATPVPAGEVFAALSPGPVTDAAPPSLELEPIEPRFAPVSESERSPYRPPGAAVSQEQSAASGEIRYAGFWVRFCAASIDGFLLVLAGLLIGVVLGAALFLTGNLQLADNTALQLALNLGVPWLYYALQESGSACATWGKRAFHLQVLHADSLARISFLRATGRAFARYLSMLPLFLGYAMQPYNERKRALHDFICGTVVVVEREYSRALLAVIIGLNVLFTIAGAVFIAYGISQLGEWRTQGRVASVVAAVEPATQAVQGYVSRTGQPPATLDEAGFDTRQPIDGVRSLAFDPKGGVITVTLDFEPLSGQTFLFVPQRLSNEAIDWRCRPGTMSGRYLPRACAGQARP